MQINQNNLHGDNNVTIGQQPKHLNDRIKKYLSSHLNPSEKMHVIAALGDGEAISFAQEIKDYLTTEGYIVEGISEGVRIPPIKGLGISMQLDEGGRREISVGHQ